MGNDSIGFGALWLFLLFCGLVPCVIGLTSYIMYVVENHLYDVPHVILPIIGVVVVLFALAKLAEKWEQRRSRSQN